LLERVKITSLYGRGSRDSQRIISGYQANRMIML
jgi:hypothetical protein